MASGNRQLHPHPVQPLQPRQRAGPDRRPGAGSGARSSGDRDDDVAHLELATISPPFGLSLFVIKGIASPDTTMEDLYRAALPFVGLNFLVMELMISSPPLMLWLPSLMK
jgi:hypothetical protein